MSEKKYLSIISNHNYDMSYFPGKHSLNILSIFFNRALSLVKRESPPPRKIKTDSNAYKKSETEVDAFFNALLKSSVDFRNVKIILIEVNGSARNDSFFINEVNKTLRESDYSSKLNIESLDMSSILTKEKYFNFDDHITSYGHLAIAKEIHQLMSK